MSKYADIEQIKKTIREEWVKYMPSDLDINLSFVLGKIAEVPTIEVSEEVLKATKKFNCYTIADENADMGMRTQIEPIIEVSEDCIDRDLIISQLLNLMSVEKEERYEGMDKALKLIEHAPSVVPQVPNEDCISREYLEEQLQQIEDITAMAHIDLGEDPYDETEEITMPISTVRKIFKNAPSVVPTQTNANQCVESVGRAEGEWINKQEKYQMAKCSNCKKITMHEMWGDKLVYYDYCPNCGSKMKDASSVVPTTELVHCKECKFKRLYDGETKYFYCALEDRPNRNWSVDEWNFCWWGERIEE